MVNKNDVCIHNLVYVKYEVYKLKRCMRRYIYVYITLVQIAINKRGNVFINEMLRYIHATIVAVERQ